MQYSHLLFLSMFSICSDSNTVSSFLLTLFKMKYIKNFIEIKQAICQRVYIRLSFLFKYCLHVEIIPFNFATEQVGGEGEWSRVFKRIAALSNFSGKILIKYVSQGLLSTIIWVSLLREKWPISMFFFYPKSILDPGMWTSENR